MVVFHLQRYIKWGGSAWFFAFFLLLLIDPTATIFDLKDLCFVGLLAYHLLFFKPDLSKLPLIFALAAAYLLPWIIAVICVRPIGYQETLGYFKALTPSLLLLYVHHYNLIKTARIPVLLTAFGVVVLYIICINNHMWQNMIYIFMLTHDNTILMSPRTILGFDIFTFYPKAIVAFLFVLGYYMHAFFYDKKRLLTFPALVLLFFVFAISGTRSTMLAPFFLLFIIGIKAVKRTRYAKYILYPFVLFLGVVAILVLVAAAGETHEASNTIKYGHLNSYATLFNDHPEYLLIGQGPGTSFYSEGFNKVVYQTEWSYLEQVRMLGIFSLVVIAVFAKPLRRMWLHGQHDERSRSMFYTYLVYLLIAGTNPLLLTSTGMAMMLMAYSYEASISEK